MTGHGETDSAWCVIVNPSAGHGSDLTTRTAAALQDHGINNELHVSESPAHLAELTRLGRRRGATRFAAVGGDGTAHLLINALLVDSWDAPPTVAILPAGSGSDFIRTFALPKRLEDAVAHLDTDAVYPTDIGVLAGSFGTRRFLNAANVGVAAGAAEFAARLPSRLGGLRYTVGFWLTLARHRPAEVELTVGDRVFRGPAISIVMANGQYFGGGMNIAPRATVMDGLLDIQVFSGPRRQAFTVMPRVVRGLHLSHPGVRRFTGSQFTLESEVPLPVEADGEMIGTGSIRGWLEPAAIRFKI
jgi:YegS/Rv2252/BmrU family lipid kinase